MIIVAVHVANSGKQLMDSCRKDKVSGYRFIYFFFSAKAEQKHFPRLPNTSNRIMEWITVKLTGVIIS